MRSRSWKLRIKHIIDAAEKIERYTSGMDFEAFRKDDRTVDAVINNMLIIGEAARFIPEPILNRYPQVPWQSIRDMRNILIHAYDRVDVKTVWDTLACDFDALKKTSKAILENEPEEIR